MDLSKYQHLSKKVDISGNDILPYLLAIVQYIADKGEEVQPFPKTVISRDNQYQNQVLGKTAYYSPQDKAITLYTAGRHPKDIIRSFCHELVHHMQNLRGDFGEDIINKLSDPAYAQNDDHLNKMEAEAYLKGNMWLRGFEDQYKKK